MKSIITNLIVILLTISSINIYATNNQDSLKIQCRNLIEEGKKVVRYDLKKGLQLFSDAIKLLNLIDIEKLDQKDKIDLSRCLINRAHYCCENDFYLNRSIQDTKNRIAIISDSSSKSLGGTHNLLAQIYKKQGEYELAEIHYQESINIFKKLNDIANRNIINNNLATAYFYQKKYDKALKTLALYYSKLDSIRNKRNYSLTYGNIYDEKGKTNSIYLDSAYFYYKKALDYSSGNEKIADSKSNLGITLTKLKRYDEANDELDESYRLLKEHYNGDEYNTKYAEYFINKGDIFESQGNLDSALVYHNLAIIQCLKDSLWNRQNIDKNPSKNQLLLCEVKPKLLESIKSKANTAHLLFKKNNQKKYLELSQKCYLTYDQLFKIMWQEYAGNESKLFWVSDSRETYLKAIDGAIENNEINTAINFTNSNKAVLLNNQLKKLNLANGSKISQELFYKEKELNSKIASTDSDSTKLVLYNELDSLRGKMKKKDPQYFSLLYEVPQFDVTEIQKELDPETCILEFIYSEKTIHTFLITKDTLLAKSINIDSTFKNKLNQFKRILIPNKNELGKKYREVLTNTGYELYQKLLKPFEAYLKEYLIFIPDGELYGIPFAAFPTKAHQIKKEDYKSVPYLLHKHSSSYANSLDILLKQMLMKIETNKAYLGVAPIHFEKDNLRRLTHTEEEVRDARKIFKDGNLLLEEDATLQAIKADTNTYKIMHFATHATQFDKEAKMPAISLRDTSYTLNQIYASNINAEMVIISACDAGLGTSIKGEGVMSLSRGFAFNGVPSMISTLNEVGQKASADLTGHFLKNIDAGQRKAVALRNAQLAMINGSEADYAKPYNWANFILVGDNKPLYEKKTNYVLYLGLLLSFMVGLGLFFKIK